VPVSGLDLAALVIGSLFVAIGAVASAAGVSARPRMNRSATWFGISCVLYGVRLVAGSEAVQLATGWPMRFFSHLRADITYSILVPATLFVESFIGPGRYGLLRRTWQVTAVVAAGAVVVDLIVQRPFASIVVNPPLVILNIAVWFWNFSAVARQGRWSVEVRAVVAAAALLSLTAISRRSSIVATSVR